MILKHWAATQGISYQTALRWFHSGRMPVPAFQTETGTILVSEPEPGGTLPYAVYGRVSSHDQKEDLQRQLGRLRNYCASNGLLISKEVSEIGSGLNGKRKGLLGLLQAPARYHIVCEHKDRLARFGFEYLQAALAAQDRRIIVLNQEEDRSDLVQDFVSVVTSMCARIYGRRSARNRAKRALEAAGEDQ
jgi:predicted site-specific integrase-resolvase